MPQAGKCELFQYADNTCLAFHHENVKKLRLVEFEFL